MSKAIDLTGQHFGFLTVLQRDFQAQKKHPSERQAWWKCKCEACGKIKSMRGSVIKKSNSCGCIRKERKPISEQAKENIRKANEKKRLNLVGQVFTRLTVLEYADEQHQIYYNGKHKTTWKCRCSCGNICYVTTQNLRRGDTPSCGCITKENRRATLKDLTGQRFGHLQVLKFTRTINGNSKYLVRCDCGKKYQIYRNNLIQGATTSCGCTKESHGEKRIREILSSNNIDFISQKTFPDFKYSDTKGTPRFDFYLPKYNILIQYDGQQHFQEVFSFDTQESFKIRQLHDLEKNNYCFNKNITLIRIPYTHYNELKIEDLLKNSNFIIESEVKWCQILQALGSQLMQ